MLGSLYNLTIKLAQHTKAEFFLALVSFVESSFLPVPPDVMLAPMSLAKPKLVWRYAFVATVFSVLGGIFGYLLGWLFEPMMLKFINHFGYESAYIYFQQMFSRWGFFAVILAGATPIPYKVFTIGSGLLKFNLLWFTLASIIGRGLRFFLVSLVFKFYGNQVDRFCRNILDKYSKILLLAIAGLLIIYFLGSGK